MDSGHGPAAQITNFFGHFDDGSVHGPFAMFPFAGFTAADLTPGAINIIITPNGNDTWHFNYSITLNFPDGTSFTFERDNKSLSEDHIVTPDQFTLSPLFQLAVPNVLDLAESSAKAELQQVGLTGVTIGRAVDNLCEHTVGSVASQSPDSGTMVAPGSIVDLILWSARKTPCP